MRDYKNFDYLCVTVKKSAMSFLSSFYLALGWENVNCEEHRRYSNELNITFRRPHKIENKDKLQLLQVYFESALNEFGKFETNPRPRTVVFGVISALLSLGLIGCGLAMAIVGGNSVMGVDSVIWGVVSAVLGGVALIVFMSLTALLYRREGGYAKARAERIRGEMLAALEAAKPLIAVRLPDNDISAVDTEEAEAPDEQ